MFSFIHKFSSNVLDKCCEISLQMLQFFDEEYSTVPQSEIPIGSLNLSPTDKFIVSSVEGCFTIWVDEQKWLIWSYF